MLSDAALESSQHEKKKTVNRGYFLSFLTKKIVVRTKNALTSVRAEIFASTEYQGQHKYWGGVRKRCVSQARAAVKKPNAPVIRF